jgi:hypothetical protein
MCQGVRRMLEERNEALIENDSNMVSKLDSTEGDAVEQENEDTVLEVNKYMNRRLKIQRTLSFYD